MSVVSHISAPSSLGPKHDIIEDIGITNNELLPGLNTDSMTDPEVKGWLSAEFPTGASKSITPSSTQGKGSAESGGKDVMLIDLDDPPEDMPKEKILKIQKIEFSNIPSLGGGTVPIPVHGDDDLLDIPIEGRGRQDTPRSKRHEGGDAWYGGGVPKLPIDQSTVQIHMINSDSSDKK